jgi:hypothetical protein
MLTLEIRLKLVHRKPPNVTDVAPVKLIPVMLTGVPPTMLPADGVIDVISGRGDSLSLSTNTALEGAPSVSPPVGLLSVRVMFSAPSTNKSSIGVTVNVFVEKSLTPQEIVPVVATKSVPAIADGAVPVDAV